MGWQWGTTRAYCSAFAAGAAAAATFYLADVRVHPNVGRPNWETASLAVVGTVGIGSAVVRPFRIRYVDRSEKMKSKVATAVRGLPWWLEEAGCQVPIPEMGVSVWLIGGWGPRKRLKRYLRDRVSDSPGPSHVKWTKGKGVIGACWATGHAQVVDTGTIDARYGDCTEAEWREVRETTRRGLTYEDYVRIRKKYGAVVAVPIHDGERMIGVLALDGPHGSHEHFAEPYVVKTVARAARVVGNLLT